MGALEDQRLIHEDLERIEQAVADEFLEEPKHIRSRLARNHRVGHLLSHLQDQSSRLRKIYEDPEGDRLQEVQSIQTGNDFDSFYKELEEIKSFHRRYPNEPVENLERAYKKRTPEENAAALAEIDATFSGEEGFGRFFDLTTLHEQYLNLPGVRGGRRITYLQYLDTFDIFTPPQCTIKRSDKMTDAYFAYLHTLAEYLTSFMRRTRPLEDLDKLFASFEREFEQAWADDNVPGWGKSAQNGAPKLAAPSGSEDSLYCADCQKGFKNENVYEAHLSGKRHIKAVKARQAGEGANTDTNGTSTAGNMAQQLKERAVAEREFRIHKLASAMQTERGDTKVNVERKQGMTERERQQELDAMNVDEEADEGEKAESDDEGEEKIYNPLKLPLAWDGKPIPYWLYKLHGLGVEFPCEICGNFVYMGRRAFDKHFTEARHVYGLKCLGITNTTLFREITGIEEAVSLWTKIQKDKKTERSKVENIVEMEDSQGNVMPEKIYQDLAKQGLL